ncbi:hypothetical protein As57867_013649, partial [Aphanomyces stellatus]
MTTQVDLILIGRHIVPVVPEGVVLENHAIVVEKGIIKAILPVADAAALYTATETVDLKDHILIPGLVNAHTHSSMTLLRGLADDKPLCEWLMEDIWPTESKFVNAEFVRDGTLLSAAEMLRSGTTCINDMYFYPDAAAATFEQIGMRALVAQNIMEVPCPDGLCSAELFEKARALLVKYKDSSLVKIGIAPHAPYTVSDASFAKVVDLAKEFNARIHLHLHETEAECVDSQNKHASMSCHLSDQHCRPVQNMQRLGVLTDQLIAAHMTQLTDDEVDAVVAAGTHVAHC